jgi:protein-tyrosine phosphatase
MDNIFSYRPAYLTSSFKPSVYQTPSYSYGPSFSSLNFDNMNCIIDPTEELGGIYLGNYDAASDITLLKKHKIGAVLTVAAGTGLRYHPDAVSSHDVIPAMDVDYYDMTKHFDRCFDFIDKTRRSTSVLVHCWAGVSRSATIVITYLMKKYDFSFDEAHSFVKKKRKQIYPNPGFVRQMRSFDSQLRIKRNKTKEKETINEQKYKMNLSNSATFDKGSMRSSSLAANAKTFTPEKTKKNEFLMSSSHFQSNCFVFN